MAARLVEIADAVVAALNASAFQDVAAVAFTAARVVDPLVKLTALADLNVQVMARKDRVTLLTRGGAKQVDYLIDVALRKKLASAADTAEHDALLALVEQIEDFFFENDVAEIDETCVEATTDETGENQWAVAEIREAKLFVSVVTLTFRGGR